MLLIAGIAVAVLAITDTGPFDDPPTETELVEATVVKFYDAAAEGDFDAYCALLTNRARDLIQANAARLAAAAGGDLGKCPDIVALAEEAFKGGELKIRQVSVSGNRARVEANYRVEGKPGVQAKTIYLELNEQDEWRVSDPG